MGKTSELSRQKYGTFMQRSPMFSISGKTPFWGGEGRGGMGGRSKRQRDSDRKGVEQHTSCPSAGVSMSSLLLHFLPKSMVFDPHLGENRLFSSELSCNFALPIFCKNQFKKRESLVVRHRINRQTLLGFRFSEYFCRVKYNVES